MQLMEMFQPGFLLHNAFYGSLAVGLVCPLIGVYFVLRRLVFWGVALPQVASAGIACAFMLQGLGFTLLAGSEAGERHLAIIASLLFTGGAILLLVLLERRGRGAGEGRIGVIYALAWAASILLVASNPAGETEMMSLLRGEIVSMSPADFRAILWVFGSIAVCMAVFRREFLLVSYDRDMAVTLGRRVFWWDALLYLLIGLAISLGVMTVGPLVIFSFLVLPAMAALPWARGVGTLSLLASVLGGAGALGGFYFSYTYDLPLGPVIVCVSGVLFALSYGARLLKNLFN